MSHVHEANLNMQDPRIDSVPVAALKHWGALILGGYEDLNVVGAALGLGVGLLKTVATTVYIPFQQDLKYREAEALYNRSNYPMFTRERQGTLNETGSPSVRELIYTENHMAAAGGW